MALEIGRHGKSLTDREMTKECIISVVEEMCSEKLKLFKTVSLSANPVSR